MKEIPLTRGFVAIVDDEDYEWLSTVKWKYRKRYAERQELNPARPGKYMTVGMHRRIMDLGYGDPRKVDHQDGNPLNNQRSNLRICTNAQNCSNTTQRRNNTSGYKGVSWHKERQRWVAAIGFRGKVNHIGTFDTPEAAYEAYCKAARELHGEFANLGDPNPLPHEGRITKPARTSKTGLPGVHQRSQNRWMATIWQEGRRRILGHFPSPEEAHKAYCDAKAELKEKPVNREEELV